MGRVVGHVTEDLGGEVSFDDLTSVPLVTLVSAELSAESRAALQHLRRELKTEDAGVARFESAL